MKIIVEREKCETRSVLMRWNNSEKTVKDVNN